MVNNDSSGPSGPCGQWSKHFVVLVVSGPSGEWSKWSVPVASGPIGPSGQWSQWSVIPVVSSRSGQWSQWSESSQWSVVNGLCKLTHGAVQYGAVRPWQNALEAHAVPCGDT